MAAPRLLTVAVVGGLFVAASAAVAVLVWPSAGSRPPPLADVPPLPAMTRTSTIVAPVTVTLSALREAMEKTAPRDLSGKRERGVGKLLRDAEVGWMVTRGTLALAARADVLLVTAPLSGTLRITGQVGDQVGNLAGKLGGIFGRHVGDEAGKITGKAIDQRVDFRGTVTIAAHPVLTPAWRIEPNLAPQVALGDAAVTRRSLIHWKPTG